LIHGKTQNLLFCGDLIPGVPWMHLPITMGYDRFPELLIDEKKTIYEQLRANQDILYFTHDTSFAGSRFHVMDGKYMANKKWPHFQGYDL
jgi:glyoxylase-like metal-dependent hydrolase (beta-lactamase superfamily II)